MEKKKKLFVTKADVDSGKKRINLTLETGTVLKLLSVGEKIYPNINPTTVATILLCQSIDKHYLQFRDRLDLPGQTSMFDRKRKKNK